MNRLRVDPIACDGTGVCAELFPERVRLDDWGYPIIDPAPFEDQLLTHAQRAVKNCPKLALTIDSNGPRSGVKERGMDPS